MPHGSSGTLEQIWLEDILLGHAAYPCPPLASALLFSLSAAASSQLKNLQQNLSDAGKLELSYALEKRQVSPLGW